MASYSAFFPRAREILKVCNDNKPSQPTQKTSGQADLDAYREAWETDIAHYKTIPQKDKEAAAAEILERNPFKGRMLKKLSLTHPVWRSMILRMLRDGIVDTEEEDVDI